jgi:hypothetical protein
MVAQAAQFFLEVFRAQADADVKKVAIGIDFGREAPFFSFELFGYGFLPVFEIPTAEHDAGGGDDEQGNEGCAKDSEVGLVQTRVSAMRFIFTQIPAKSNAGRNMTPGRNVMI